MNFVLFIKYIFIVDVLGGHFESLYDVEPPNDAKLYVIPRKNL